METKAEIRKKILKVRQELCKEEQNRRSLKIQKQVLEHPHFQQAQWIFLYMDYKAEVQTGFLLEKCFELGKRLALPKIDGDVMNFYEVRTREDVQPGYFGILEPVTTREVTPELRETAGDAAKVKNESKAFMTVPGVAFSKDGYRMGYGKGFYDRYLARFPGIYTCGLAYECQIVEELPVETHDKKLDELIVG